MVRGWLKSTAGRQEDAKETAAPAKALVVRGSLKGQTHPAGRKMDMTILTTVLIPNPLTVEK